MKILVTGASGFIGQNLINSLKNKSAVDLVTLSRSDLNHSEIPNIKIDPNGRWMEKVTSLEVDGVVHLASCFLASHRPDQIPEIIRSNVEFPTQLIESCRNVRWFLNVGTFWQHYEQSEYSPVNLYAASKQAFIDIAQYYLETSSINFCTVKLSDTYGPGDTRRKLFNLLRDQLKSSEVLEMSPGEQEIDILHIDDVVSGLSAVIELMNSAAPDSIKNTSYGLSSGEPKTLKEIVKVFECVTGQDLNIHFGGREYRPREVMQTWRKYELVPGWRPKIKLDQGIKQFLSL
ncbi:MAG: NAD(P)-dependent oxidoreductase [Bdellovibrionales bacterium]